MSSATPATRSWWAPVGLISLTAGLGALAAALLICAGLAAPRNRTSAPRPPGPVARDHQATSHTQRETRSHDSAH